MQLSVEVARAYLRMKFESLTQLEKRPEVLGDLTRIEKLARHARGRKVATRYGVHVADAVELRGVLHCGPFIAHQLPRLAKLMSSARVAELVAQGILAPE